MFTFVTKTTFVAKVERDKNILIQTTIRQLNQFYGRRPPTSIGPPIAVHKVKVTFKDEPGEGSGVARSFYTAVAEAFLSADKLPNLETCQGSSAATPASNSSSKMQQRKHFCLVSSRPIRLIFLRFFQELLNRLRSREREREYRRRAGGGSGARRYHLSVDAPPFFAHGEPPTSASSLVNWDQSKQALGERLLPRVRILQPVWIFAVSWVG